jgi:hypothetical protein
MMNDVPRQTLRDLVDRYGRALCGDARRCEGLLRDLCGAHRREINILVSAQKERVPLDLLAAQGSMPRSMLLSRLARRLEEHSALTEEAARWAVESWALALGVVTDAEIETAKREREKKSPAVDPPQASVPPAQSQPRANTTNSQEPPSPPPPPAQTPAGARRPPQAATAPPPPRRTSAPTHNVGGPAAVTRRTPPAAPPARAQPRAGANPPPGHSTNPVQKKRGGRWRGCLVGCLLIILLSAALFVGVPFVISVLREDQIQRSNEYTPGSPQ